MNRILKMVVAIILASGLLFTSCSFDAESSPRIGNKAPDFRLSNLEGQSISLSSFQGKAVLLNFWATTCPACRLEMPHLQAVFDEWSARGLVLLAINMGEDAATVKEFIQRYRYSFPVLLDREYEVAGKYNVEFIPASFFIDKEGIIQVKISGPFPNKEAIEKYLSKIIP